MPDVRRRGRRDGRWQHVPSRRMLRCSCADSSPRADYYVGCIIIIVVVALMTLYHKQ
jgi:hypothetical protein